jgi:hypothetical protein
MRFSHVLTTAFLSAALLWPGSTFAGPPARPTPAPPTLLKYCDAYGIYAYNRAADRDHGFAFAEVLWRSQQWDTASQVTPEAWQMHDIIIRMVYRHFDMTPTYAQDDTVEACMRHRGVGWVAPAVLRDIAVR